MCVSTTLLRFLLDSTLSTSAPASDIVHGAFHVPPLLLLLPLRTTATDSSAWTGTIRCISRRRSTWSDWAWTKREDAGRGRGFVAPAALVAVDWRQLRSGHSVPPGWPRLMPVIVENFHSLVLLLLRPSLRRHPVPRIRAID